MTEWRKVDGYENYLVGDNGEVFDIENNCIRKQYIRGPYKIVSLKKGDKYKIESTHRIVAMVFSERKEYQNEVNHKDGNKLNNCASNLEWVSRSENIRHRIYELNEYTPIGKPQAVKCVETGIVYRSHAEAARETGCNRKSISACISGKLKHTGGYTWIKA